MIIFYINVRNILKKLYNTSMHLPRFYKLAKLIIFATMGVLVLVFNKAIMSNEGALINGVVGAIIAIYGLEGLILPLVRKQWKEKQVVILNCAINILIAVMIFLLENHPHEFRVVCIIWSIWSIMREGEEIVEKGFGGIKEHPITSIVNFAESIVVIVFSVMLICAKDFYELEHHAHAHVILLGIELIIEVVWVYIADFEAKCIKRIKAKHANND